MIQSIGEKLAFNGIAAKKKRIRVDDLLARFEEVRRADQLDEIAAEMLRSV